MILVSLCLEVLLSIPPAVTGWLARSCLGSLSRIYRQATLEAPQAYIAIVSTSYSESFQYFDLPMQLATAGLKAIATWPNETTFALK